MRGIGIGIWLIAALVPSSVASEPVRLTIGRTVVQLDAELPVLACTVIRTSHDPDADERACARAREQRGIAAPTMSFQPDRTGRFISCRPHPAAEPSPAFQAACSSELERIQEMRAMIPIDMSAWLEREDLVSLVTVTGQAEIRIGVDEEGRAAYCLLAEPRGNLRLERHVCRKIMRRARFHPARDLQGRPMPSGYRHTLSAQRE